MLCFCLNSTCKQKVKVASVKVYYILAETANWLFCICLIKLAETLESVQNFFFNLHFHGTNVFSIHKGKVNYCPFLVLVQIKARIQDFLVRLVGLEILGENPPWPKAAQNLTGVFQVFKKKLKYLEKILYVKLSENQV